jgi:hypothetical protein
MAGLEPRGANVQIHGDGNSVGILKSQLVGIPNVKQQVKDQTYVTGVTNEGNIRMVKRKEVSPSTKEAADMLMSTLGDDGTFYMDKLGNLLTHEAGKKQWDAQQTGAASRINALARPQSFAISDTLSGAAGNLVGEGIKSLLGSLKVVSNHAKTQGAERIKPKMPIALGSNIQGMKRTLDPKTVPQAVGSSLAHNIGANSSQDYSQLLNRTLDQSQLPPGSKKLTQATTTEPPEYLTAIIGMNPGSVFSLASDPSMEKWMALACEKAITRLTGPLPMIAWLTMPLNFIWPLRATSLTWSVAAQSPGQMTIPETRTDINGQAFQWESTGTDDARSGKWTFQAGASQNWTKIKDIDINSIVPIFARLGTRLQKDTTWDVTQNFRLTFSWDGSGSPGTYTGDIYLVMLTEGGKSVSAAHYTMTMEPYSLGTSIEVGAKCFRNAWPVVDKDKLNPISELSGVAYGDGILGVGEMGVYLFAKWDLEGSWSQMQGKIWLEVESLPPSYFPSSDEEGAKVYLPNGKQADMNTSIFDFIKGLVETDSNESLTDEQKMEVLLEDGILLSQTYQLPNDMVNLINYAQEVSGAGMHLAREMISGDDLDKLVTSLLASDRNAVVKPTPDQLTKVQEFGGRPLSALAVYAQPETYFEQISLTGRFQLFWMLISQEYVMNTSSPAFMQVMAVNVVKSLAAGSSEAQEFYEGLTSSWFQYDENPDVAPPDPPGPLGSTQVNRITIPVTSGGGTGPTPLTKSYDAALRRFPKVSIPYRSSVLHVRQ